MSATYFSVEVEGGKVQGWREGSGEPALILHGGPGLSDYTSGLSAELSGLFERIRYQQRGSEPTSLRGPYTVESHLGDAVAVLDGLSIEQTWVIGHSWGGHLALHLAGRYPNRLLGLVLIDSLGAVPDGGMATFFENLASRLPPDVAAKSKELEDRLTSGSGTDEDARESLRIVWPYYFAGPEKAPPMPDISWNLACYTETLASVQEHFEQRTLEQSLPSVDVPTLFVAADGSLMPVSASSDSAALMRNARVEVVDRCGHFPWMEKPGAIRGLVEEMLGA